MFSVNRKENFIVLAENVLYLFDFILANDKEERGLRV
jgi:hypothetical protein